MLKKDPQILYHYCSLNTLSKIIGEINFGESALGYLYGKKKLQKLDEKSKRRFESLLFTRMISSVQLTSFHHLNDPKESVVIRDLYREVDEDDPPKGISDYFDCILKDRTKTFVFCMSEHPDNLTMWRAYGDDGRGVCIGFKREKLDELISKAIGSLGKEEKSKIKALIKGVKYVSNREELHDLNLCVCEDIENGVDVSSMSTDDILRRSVDCWSVKSSDYDIEKEWRLIVTMDDNYFNGEFVRQSYVFDPLKYFNLKYRFLDHDMTERLFLRLDADCIEEIIIGPKSRVKKGEMQRYLKSHFNDKVKVYKSKKPYV